MHKEVAKKSNKKRRDAVDTHNRKTYVRHINYGEGDFVLRGVLQTSADLSPHFVGPFRVLECRSDLIFFIKNLLTGKKEEVHGRRLKFFRNADFVVTQEIKDNLAYQADE